MTFSNSMNPKLEPETQVAHSTGLKLASDAKWDLGCYI